MLSQSCQRVYRLGVQFAGLFALSRTPTLEDWVRRVQHPLTHRLVEVGFQAREPLLMCLNCPLQSCLAHPTTRLRVEQEGSDKHIKQSCIGFERCGHVSLKVSCRGLRPQ